MEKLPKNNRNIILSIFLLLGIAFSVVTVVMATAPDPGHNFTETSGGFILGDLMYGSGVDTAAALAGNITVTKKFLNQTGNGSVSAVPVWSALTSADVGLGSVENTTLSTWVGSTNVTTLGTIGTGAWNATVIADGKIATALTGKTYNALTLTAAGTGFTIAGGTVSKTLTVTGDATISGTPLSNPMTTLGDIIYGGASGAATRLGGSAGFLKSTGAAAPAWSTINLAASADVGTSILPTANGGTGMAFFTVAGPAATAKTFTFPNANATILTTNAAVTVAQGGTGLAATADDAVFVGDSTSAVTARALPSCSGATTDKLLYNITTNTFSCGVDQTGGGSNYRTLVTLGSDVINNNATLNTLQDCTGLSFAVVSGTRYRFHALIWYTSAAATTGSRWTLNGPTFTNLAYRSQYSLTATTHTFNNAVAYSIPAASNATSLTAGNIAIIEGTILPSAAGTVIVRFASEVASSAITCKAGSTLEWW